MAVGGLLGDVRRRLRAGHYSPRTERAYVHWVRRFVRFAGLRHPGELGEAEVTAFLTDLAVRGRVSAATQNQALAALLYLYREVLGYPLGWLDGVVRARRPVRLPTVLCTGHQPVVLDPDVAPAFPDSAAVNRAHRKVAGLPQPSSPS